MKKSSYYILFILGIILFFFLEIAFGTAAIGLDEIASFFLGNLDASSYTYDIITQLRIPRALTALVVGSALAVAGLLMQTFFRNPLAGPSILGVSSGASLGVAVVTLATGTTIFSRFGERMMVFFAALIGALLVLALVVGVSRFVKQSVTLLIIGLMISYLTSALVSVLQFNANEASLKVFVVWGMGSFANTDWVTWQYIAWAFVLSLGLLLLVYKDLNVLLLGERYAKSMGVNTSKNKIIIILIAGIIVAVSTAFCGPIAFIGLAVPHLARVIFKTGDHRITLPATLLLGGFLGLVADFVSRMPWTEGGLPLNTVTAMIGAPVVIAYILKNNKQGYF